MAPKKRTKHVNWPKYVTVVNKIYVVYRPRIAVEQREYIATDKHGFLKPAIKLGKITDGDDKILRAYMAAKKQLEVEQEPNKNTLLWVSQQYFNSTKYKELSKGAQDNYRLAAKVLQHPIALNGGKATLGDIKASDITKPLVQAIAQKRLDERKAQGHKGETSTNMETAFLSAMLTWAVNWIVDLGISQNPIKNLSKFKEDKRERYVTDQEYQLQLTYSSNYLPAFFEIQYLCAARSIEVRSITMADILPEGLRINRRKGSRSNIISWNPRLKAAVDAAKKYRNIVRKVTSISGSDTLFVNTSGEPITKTGLNSSMQALKKRMEKSGQTETFWTLHMLKHKGITDSENKEIAGHVSKQMRDLYDHSLPIFKPAK